MFSHTYYCYIPTTPTTGRLHVLSPSDGYCNGSFVIIPYVNGGEVAPSPAFYKIDHIEDITLPEAIAVKSENINLRSLTGKKEYLENFNRLKAHIQRGDIYELNYCIRFASEAHGFDPVQAFRSLYEASLAPYAMLVRLADEFIICASPELFLQKQGSRLVTKPIKGTMRRGKTAAEDVQLREALSQNLKDRTENIMAVDVARNDLSIVAARGSVKVEKLCEVESFKTVHQLVSTVVCEVQENEEDQAALFSRIITATFPMASMTGAPKVSAMNLIGRFENFSRGYYSGAMGIIDEKGDFILNVIIRSIFYNSTTRNVSYCAGGAITFMSEGEKEYEECLLKTEVMRKALGHQ
jgi:para-aminobenzoate synthetase component I